MLRLSLPLVLALTTWSACIAPAWAELPPSVRQALRQAQVPTEALGVLVTPLSEGNAPPRLAHRENEAMNPASVMKLFTTYAGLQLLGPEHVWRTRIYTTGPVQGGVLQGSLVVQGGGDPKLVLERAQAMVAEIQARGVRRVQGDIVLDNSVFDVSPRSEAFDDEPLRPYNVRPDGLLMNFKSVIYRFVPDTARGRVRVQSEPPMAGLEVPPELPLKDGPCNDWRSALRADFQSPLRPAFAGSYPASCGERHWPVAFAAPDEFAPRMLHALWTQAGGELGGRVRSGKLPPQARLLLEHASLPLRDIIADINKMSNNVMAQQLFLTLSAEMGAPGRFEASHLRLARWWREGFPGQFMPVLENGSGLSRTERSTAAALGELLRHARQGPQAEAFVQSLAVAGVDGTVQRMKERMPQSPLIGRAWLKTGSLRDVASVAGYVQGESGRLYSVVAIVNHPQAGQARAALDQLLDWTARDLQPPLAGAPSGRRQRHAAD
jgi:D-alanyl-D-alanine carboxypeptidase/D-alanyl-D-alanine-endopeptidase (penicillin-binding protein 4)